jgi:hypothetical protein
MINGLNFSTLYPSRHGAAWCNGRVAVGATGGISARILDALRCVRGQFWRRWTEFLRGSHFGCEMAHAGSGMTGGMPEGRSVPLGEFLREFLVTQVHLRADGG